MNNINTFVFDLDGTLLNSKGDIMPNEVAAINKLISSGNTIIFATGRNVMKAKGIIKECFGNNIPKNFVLVGSSGSFIKRSNKKPIIICSFTKNEQLQIVDMLREYKAPIFGCTPTKKYAYIRMTFFDYIKNIFKFFCGKRNYSVGFKFFNKNICKFQLFSKMKLTIDKDYTDTFFNYDENEIVKKGINKANALSALHLDLSKTIYFGDSENDILGFKKCAISVAMKNADDSIKKEAVFVTRKTNNESGVSDFLYMENFIK